MTENFDPQDVIETPAPAEETVKTLETETPQENPQNEELVKVLKEKEELEAKNKKLYARLKESEKSKPQATDNQTLDPKDIIALSKVHEDDIDEVLRHAKINNIKPSEALKDKYLGIFLRERSEERKTAEATNTRNTPARQTNKVSGDEILSKVRQGKISEEDDMDKLTDAYLASKRPKAVR